MRLLILLFLALVLSSCAAFDSFFDAYLAQQRTPEPSAPALVGDAVRGDSIFHNGLGEAPGCVTCHTLNPQIMFALGPNLIGVGERAAIRVDGLTAEAYLHQSIVEPSAYVVTGFRNIMYPLYADHLSEQDIQDLIAYLLTLE